MYNRKIHGCRSNSENSSRTKVIQHIPSGFTISSFRNIENKLDVYRGQDCMKTFCELLSFLQGKKYYHLIKEE